MKPGQSRGFQAKPEPAHHYTCFQGWCLVLHDHHSPLSKTSTSSRFRCCLFIFMYRLLLLIILFLLPIQPVCIGSVSVSAKKGEKPDRTGLLSGLHLYPVSLQQLETYAWASIPSTRLTCGTHAQRHSVRPRLMLDVLSHSMEAYVRDSCYFSNRPASHAQGPKTYARWPFSFNEDSTFIPLTEAWGHSSSSTETVPFLLTLLNGCSGESDLSTTFYIILQTYTHLFICLVYEVTLRSLLLPSICHSVFALCSL